MCHTPGSEPPNTVGALTGHLILDAGTLDHPDGAPAQVAGASLQGPRMALFEGTGPAIGNAVFAAVGAGLRHPPMRHADVPAALKSA